MLQKFRSKYFCLFLVALAFCVFASGGCGGGGGSSDDNNNGNNGNNNDGTNNSGYYTVTFDSNGGSAIESQKVKAGGYVTMSAPTKSGNAFSGWYTSNNFEEMFLCGDGGDPVTQNMTLYARWVENNQNLLRAQHAIGEIEIGYSGGDNANNVTKDLSLPTSVEGLSGVSITWSSSNPDSINSSGKVTRAASDVNVTLTVIAVSENERQTKDFKVRVIKTNSRERNTIPNNMVLDIDNMNADNDSYHISYNDNNHVSRIQGQFSSIAVENVDDAVDALQSVHSVLGISDPYSELESSAINDSDTGTKYRFSQVYDGKKVFGRSVTVSANNDDGTTNFLQSSFVASSVLDEIDFTASISSDDAEQAAIDLYLSGDVKVASADTELGIYALDKYESNPVPAYSVYVYGTDSADNGVSDIVYVDATDGSILKTVSNLSNSTVTGWGKNEFDTKLSFDVSFAPTDIHFFYMYDENLNVQIYDAGLTYKLYTRVGSEFNLWSNKHQVSAFVNMRKIVKWLRDNLNRNSISGDGSKVKVITNASSMLNPRVGNAAWIADSGGHSAMYINEKPYPDYSCAVGLDVLAHESGHGMLQYMINDFNSYCNLSDAINEAYADIIGCLVEQNWIMGEKLYQNQSGYIRDIQNRATSPRTAQYYIDSMTLSHAAYLMQRNGLSWEKLGKVWYNSMSMGFDGTSTFNDVRTFVIWTAENLEFSESEIQIIVDAFNSVGIGGRSKLSGTVLTADSNAAAISDATVKISKRNFEKTTTTDSNGQYSLTSLDWGTYDVEISKTNYVTFNGTREIGESADATLNVSLMTVGNSTVSGTVRNATNAVVLSGMKLDFREGWSALTGDIVKTATTDDSGNYSVELPNGFYTITATKEGFVTTPFNISVSENLTQNMNISPVLASGDCRVVLSWADDPVDLDAHVRFPSSYGTSEVYYGHKFDHDHLGNVVSLDIDVIKDEGTDGPETIVFHADAAGTYEYFVHWYRGTGTWTSSQAHVVLYYGNQTKTWDIPASTSTDHCWKVFEIRNGVIVEINTFSSDDHSGQSTQRYNSVGGTPTSRSYKF